MPFQKHFHGVLCLIIHVIFKCNAFEAYRQPKQDYNVSAVGLAFGMPYYSSYGIQENQEIILRCKVRSEKQPEFIWEKITNNPENETTDVYNNPRITFENKFRTKQRYISKLTINDTQLSDSGIYRCRVTSGMNTYMERRFKITVQESIKTPVRLISLTHEGEGLVQLYHQDKWRAVCKNQFTNIEASVICRSLGYPFGGEPRLSSETDNIFYSDANKRYPKHIRVELSVRCSLNATEISQCLGVQMHAFCSRNDIILVVGVTCRLTGIEIPKNPYRLDGSPMEGSVEVFKNGYWGKVCTEGIGETEIKVICKMVGYNYGGIEITTRKLNYNYEVSYARRQLLQNLTCPANAESIEECTHEDWGEQCSSCRCDGYSNLAVRCWTRSEYENNPDVKVRLAAGGDNDGRVEIRYNNSTWGTVRDMGWQEANMVCQTLGFQYGGEKTYNAMPSESRLRVKYIDCIFVSDLSECTLDWREDYVLQAIGLRCRTEPLIFPEFRLVGPNSSKGEGKLEYLKDGQYGTVCKAYMGTSEASTFCYMMGFRNGGNILKNSYALYGRPVLEYMDCPWNSTDILQCSNRDYGYKEYRESCKYHRNDAAIKCRNEPFPEYELKLHGEKTENEGQLMIKYDGSWRRVCIEHFISTNAVVVCRQLGYRHGGEYRFGETVTSIDVPGLNIECNGQENNIGQCNSITVQTICPYGAAVFVKCYRNGDTELNMNVSLAADGHVLVHHRNKSWMICSSSWDNIGAKAVCNMLGKSDGEATHIFGVKSQYNVQNLFCPRGANQLGDCFFGPWLRFNDPWQKGRCQHNIHRGGVNCL